MAVRAGRLTTRRWLPALLVGAVLAAGSILGAIAVAHADADRDRAGLDEQASLIATQVRIALERDLTEVERLAATAGASPAALRVAARERLSPELLAVAHAAVTADGLVIDTVVPQDLGLLVTGADVTEIDPIDIVVTRVFTEADPASGGPVTIDGRRIVTVGAPVLAGPSADESAQRASVIGAILGAVDADRLVAGWDGSWRLIAPNGQEVGDEDATGDVRRATVDVRDRAWTLLLDAPARSVPGRAWLVVGIGLAVTATVTLAYADQLRRRRNAEEQASTRLIQLERIANAGARLQQSLDLGELLPSFAVALADDFELRAVTIAMLDEHGDLVESFATGRETDRGAAVPATIDLPLRRGFRAVGVLTIRPGRELDAAELTSLQTLADLLAVAMSNAQLFERELLSTARLRDLDALKNAFLGTVSHELRTSMTAIMGFGELLTDSWDKLDDDRRREMASRIRRSAGSLRHLVDDLLDFARLEQERLRVSPRSVDLASVVRQTVDNLAPLLGRHEVELRTPDHLVAWADPVAIERILANLVSNAAKYSPEESTVTIVVEPMAGAARLVVSDQGPGIPPEERRRIFARFYRLDSPQAVRTRGAGIGLAILRDFADRSGAEVNVDEAPGGGARFTVDFPITPPVDAPELAAAT